MPGIPGILPIPTMGFGITEEFFIRKCGHLLVTGQNSPGLVVQYQPTCSLDHAEDVSYYVTFFSATTL